MDTITSALQEAIEQALQFDYSQHRRARPKASASLDTYSASDVICWNFTESFSSRLLVMRSSGVELLDRLSQGNVTILEGESGAGKSSVITAVERIMSGLPVAGAPVMPPRLSRHRCLVLNCHRLKGSLATKPAYAQKLEFFIRQLNDGLLKLVDDVVADSRVRNEWLHHLTMESPQFADFRDRYLPSSVDDCTQVRMEGEADLRSIWTNCKERWNKLPDAERVDDHLWPLLNEDLVVHIFIDNVDQLPDFEAVEAAAEAASTFMAAVPEKIGVVFACRPQQTSAVIEALNFAHWDTVRLDPVTMNEDLIPDAQTGLREMFDVFRLRLDELKTEQIISDLADLIVDHDLGSPDEVRSLLTSHVHRIVSAAHELLEAYFRFDLDDSPHAELYVSPHAAAPRSPKRSPVSSVHVAFTGHLSAWHNGSLRELSRSLYVLIARYDSSHANASPLSSEHLNPDAELWRTRELDGSVREIRDARTFLFRHILFHNLPSASDDYEFPRLHSSLRLFDPQPDASAPYFYFTRLRILQMLGATTEESLSVDFISSSLQSGFNVSKESVRSALGALSRRDRYESGLVRIQRRKWHSSDDEMTRDSQVALLPAGQLVAGLLCKTCEFLYWSAISHQAARSEVARALGVNENKLMTSPRLNSEEFRVRVAIAYLGVFLLDRFVDEHPYLAQPAGEHLSGDGERLQHFARLFGFGPRIWFLSQCLQQIEGFCARGDIEIISLPENTQEQIANIRAAVDRLSELALDYGH